ncbi:MAG: hypothetical protein ACFCUE_14020 [Candidatus Bathyarchaeia archaeon]|jgi:hypothetical protein
MKNSKALKQLAATFEAYTELSLVMFGVLAVLLVLVFPLRMDIRLLLGGFGLYLVATGVVAKILIHKK